MTDTSKGIVYDAASTSRILGLPVECNDPAPLATEGEIVIYYGGWSLNELRDSPAGKSRMWQEDKQAFDAKNWTAEPSYYRISLHGIDSNQKGWRSAAQAMRPLPKITQGWCHPPVVVAATALLVHLMRTGNDLLDGDWLRCFEAFPGGGHVGLYVGGGRVRVGGGWDDFRYNHLWMVAALNG
jgi:hypothetical protein